VIENIKILNLNKSAEIFPSVSVLWTGFCEVFGGGGRGLI